MRDRKAREQQQMAEMLVADQPKRSAIVTARKPGPRRNAGEDMTPEEHKRRGDAADVMFQEMKRRIAEKARGKGV